ncbi:MAG TPA: TetR/AcrR family transcriptional regulator [Syntrophomonadaceae bacterium]|nr:TetR/AcrR family transcriptional regulator [Syntrophomonadaceae bacterium]
MDDKMNGFELRKNKKMESILRATIELFCQRGLKAVSIAEIAEKAHVSQVSIYNYFGSKTKLARQAVFSLMDEKTVEFEVLLHSELSFQEKFAQMVFEKTQTRDQYSEAFFQSDIWTDPQIQSYMEEFMQTRAVPLVLDLIEQGRKEGCVNQQISDQAILIYIRMFNEILNRESLSTDIRYEMASLFFYGLLGMPVGCVTGGRFSCYITK